MLFEGGDGSSALILMLGGYCSIQYEINRNGKIYYRDTQKSNGTGVF